jgi:magnesium transporter
MSNLHNKKSARNLTKLAHRPHAPGTSPGFLGALENAYPTQISYFLYSAEALDEKQTASTEDIDAAYQKIHERGANKILWINVAGLKDIKFLEHLSQMFSIDPLIVEDIVSTQGRPKVDLSNDLIYILMRLPPRSLNDTSDQISLILGHNYVLSFDEKPGDCFDPVRNRLRNQGRLCTLGADYLAYRLLDAVVDGYFPVLEEEGEQLENLEEALNNPRVQVPLKPIHAVKRRLLTHRRAIWPLREVIGSLAREKHALIGKDTQRYLRDTYDHVVELIDLVEIYRETATSIAELSLSLVSARMNDVMKFLAVVSAIFMPLTFIVGIYGMNFNTDVSPWNMPELDYGYGYPAVLAGMALIAFGLLGYFRWRGFIGKRGTTLDDL